MRSSATTRIRPAGASRPGSALIIVIGTLALISVFAAIYISVGQSDRRSATTIRERTNLAEITNAYADHIARTVAADRLDALLQPVDEQRQYQAPRRIVTDAPWTDWTQRSESNELWRLANPVGGNQHPLPRNFNGDDPRVASDPWLAATRPTYLGDPNARILSANDPTRAYLDNRDWYQISNLAPDARFVNLANLRANFRAQPGVGSGRLSENLTLFRLLNPNSANSPVQAFLPLQSGSWIPGANIPGFALPPQDYLNTPAVFTMFQRYAFLPADPTFVTYNRNGQVAGSQAGLLLNDPDFAPYQWADTDGDRMYDARWFELTAARTPSPTSGNRTDIQRFYDDSEYRVFAAARVIDLSSMVNVNTAIEGLTPPTQAYPLGLTPAEIDIRRLLTMQDAAEEYDSIDFVIPRQPLSFSSLWEPGRIRGTGANQDLRVESDYTNYTHVINTPNPRLLEPDSNAMLVGRYAAAALRRGMEQHSTLSPAFRGARTQFPPANEPFLLYEGGQLQRQSNDPATDFGYYAGGRAETYLRSGRVDPSRLSFSAMGSFGTEANANVGGTYFDANTPESLALYGMQDLAELLTYHGLNDPDITSRLEHNALGRYDFGEGQERYSPLLSTRPLAVDRDRHAEIRTDANPNRPRIIDGRIAQQSLAFFELSPRTVLTPLSGAAPLVPMSVVGPTVRSPGGQAGTIQPATVTALTIQEAAVTFNSIRVSASSSFGLFYHALAGELEMYRAKRQGTQDGPNPGILNQIWQPDLTIARDSPYATLFYAHRGPELALRIAAHTAVNTKDAYDGDRTPTVASLVLHNQFGDSGIYRNLRQSLQNPADRDNFDILANQSLLGIYYPGLINSQTRFDIDAVALGSNYEVNRRPQQEWVLPRQNPPPAPRQAVNVIGVEATPVLTEVASFYVYIDAPVSAGGDTDFFTVALPPDGAVPVTTPPVTISSSLNPGNPDLLAAVVAFQLHNPWDESIVLGGNTNANARDIMWRVNDDGDRFNPQNNLEFDYYIEYNGRYFKLGEYWEFTPDSTVPLGFDGTAADTVSQADGTLLPADARIDPSLPNAEEFQYRNVTLAPGETRVFYATFHPRLDGHDLNLPGTLENKWARVLNGYGDMPAQFTDTGNFDADNDNRADGFDGRGWTGPAQEWIERQLQVNNRAARIHAFDPTTGRLVDPSSGVVGNTPVFTDLVGTPGNTPTVPGRPADNKQVRLWRKYVAPNYEEATNNSLANFPRGTRRNIVQNDILVDRLYLAEQSESVNYLDVPLSGGNIPIVGTVSLQESLDTFAPPIARNDNSGLSITRWASVRRRDRENGLENATAVGRVLPWMIQSRSNPSETWIRTTNKAGRPDAAPEAFPDALTAELFFTAVSGPMNRVSTSVTRTGTAQYDVDYTPIGLLRDGLNRRGQRVATMGQRPYDKNTRGDGPVSVDVGGRFPVQTLGANTASDTLFANSTLQPEIMLGRTANAARVAEALTVLGTGPTWAPVIRTLATAQFEDREWMTLPEAFAAALGYEDFTTPEPDAANHPWFDAVRQTPGAPAGITEYVLDNLQLRLDDYVAFLNITRAPSEIGPAGRPVFDNNPTNPSQFDLRRGTGVPLALGVIDRIRPFAVLDLPGDAALSEVDRDALRLTRPIMGLVNIQTAPLKVLRLLPGLTPSAQFYRANEAAGTLRPEWWAAPNGIANDSALGVALLQPALPTDNPDVAAGIVAYRDRMQATPRARSNDPANALRYLPDPSNNLQLATNFRSEFVFGPSNPVDRATISGILGLRGSPMFSSLGELLAVSIDENNTALSPAQRRHLTIQAYYGDGTNLGAPAGATANRVSIDPKLASGRPGVVIDDYAERLALAAGIMNTTSVRSDYFAAWLVIQGFRESDVNGLRPEDPLVPSFKRRYLMVIDRSNVIEPGDSPRVVLFKELPL